MSLLTVQFDGRQRLVDCCKHTDTHTHTHVYRQRYRQAYRQTDMEEFKVTTSKKNKTKQKSAVCGT